MISELTSCKISQLGKEYMGTLNRSSSGYPCQFWNTQKFNLPKYFPDNSMANVKNHCRNPNNNPEGPWCYTDHRYVTWQYCDVPRCTGNSKEF